MRAGQMNLPTPAAALVGTTGLSFPLWADLLTRWHEIGIAVGGLLVLILTVRGKMLDNAIKREQLRDMREDDRGET